MRVSPDQKSCFINILPDHKLTFADTMAPIDLGEAILLDKQPPRTQSGLRRFLGQFLGSRRGKEAPSIKRKKEAYEEELEEIITPYGNSLQFLAKHWLAEERKISYIDNSGKRRQNIMRELDAKPYERVAFVDQRLGDKTYHMYADITHKPEDTQHVSSVSFVMIDPKKNTFDRDRRDIGISFSFENNQVKRMRLDWTNTGAQSTILDSKRTHVLGNFLNAKDTRALASFLSAWKTRYVQSGYVELLREEDGFSFFFGKCDLPYGQGGLDMLLKFLYEPNRQLPFAPWSVGKNVQKPYRVIKPHKGITVEDVTGAIKGALNLLPKPVRN